MRKASGIYEAQRADFKAWDLTSLPVAAADRQPVGPSPQQLRILRATMCVTAVGGYSSLSTAAITAVAGVSRPTFRRWFASPEAALLAVHDACVAQLSRRIEETDDADLSASERLEAWLATTVDYLTADPVRAETLMVEVHSVGSIVLSAQEEALAVLIARVADVLIAEGIGPVHARRGARLGIGAVRDALRTRIALGLLDELPSLVPELAAAAFPMVAARRRG